MGVAGGKTLFSRTFVGGFSDYRMDRSMGFIQSAWFGLKKHPFAPEAEDAKRSGHELEVPGHRPVDLFLSAVHLPGQRQTKTNKSKENRDVCFFGGGPDWKRVLLVRDFFCWGSLGIALFCFLIHHIYSFFFLGSRLCSLLSQ